MKNTTREIMPYGKEWKRDMMKWRKTDMIDWISHILQRVPERQFPVCPCLGGYECANLGNCGDCVRHSSLLDKYRKKKY
jgi:hypothetical protein